MESAGIKPDSLVAKRIDALVLKLRRRQLVGSHPVASETVKLLRDVVAASKVASFDALLEAVTDVGRKLQDAGKKEPVINNMVLRVLKFLREEYATALQSALSSFTSDKGEVATPAQTPFAAFPLDTSTSFGMDGLSRSSSGDYFPKDEQRAGSPTFSHAKRFANMSTDSLSHSHSLPGATLSQATVSGTSSIFELLGHKEPSASTSAGPSASHPFSSGFLPSYSSSTGAQTPYSTGPSSPVDSPPAKAIKKDFFRQGSSSNMAMSGFTSGYSRVEHEFSRRVGTLKPVFIDAISELLDELGMVREQIAQQATEHIHSAEIILTIGYSKTVEAFLKAAARKRKITVVVAETCPSYLGRELALSLSSAGIPTLLIPDSSIFSLMSRISKVILGVHSVQADGSLIAITGSLPLCRAAKSHLVPVIVCTGMFKVSNEFGAGAMEKDLVMWDHAGPEEVLGLVQADQEGEPKQLRMEDFKGDLEVSAPYWDRVPQELVDLFITNIGAHPSSMIFRLLKELFE